MDNLNSTNIKQEELIITEEMDSEQAMKSESECLPDYLEEGEYKNQINIEENSHFKNKNIIYKNKIGKFDWCKATVLKLIQYWEEHECLYNSKHHSYHNKFARLGALETITTNMLDIEPYITELEVKTKMNYLRSQYVRELQKINESEKLYTGTEEMYVPTAYWYRRLAFLKDFVNTKKPRSKSSVTEPLDESSISEMDEMQSTPPNRLYQPTHDEPTTTSTTTKRKKENQIFDPDDQPPTTSASAKHKRENETTNFEDVQINKFLKSANELLVKLTKPDNPSEQCTESFIQLLKLNLRDITDPDLKDEVCQKMILLLFEYKKKQRLLSSI